MREADDDKQSDAELAEIRRAYRQAFLAALPVPLKQRLKARRAAAKQRHRSVVGQRAHRQRRMMEMLLNGFPQAQMEHALKVHKATISRDLRQVWPFGPAGRDFRYLAVRVSPDHLAALDCLAGDMMMDRLRALEEIAKAALEQNAFVARRTLRVGRGDAA